MKDLRITKGISQLPQITKDVTQDLRITKDVTQYLRITKGVTMEIINHLPTKHNTSNQFSNNPPSSVASATAKLLSTLSLDDLSLAREISIKGSVKALFLLIGRLLEVGGKCHARQRSLSNMLSDKIGKTLCRQQIGRLVGTLTELKLITHGRTTNYGIYKYELTKVGWCLFHLLNYRIPKEAPIPKMLHVIPKNVTSLTRSIKKDLNNNYLPSTEIYRETKPADKKEVGEGLKHVLDEVLKEAPREVGEKVRQQVITYQRANKITYPRRLIMHILTREHEKFKKNSASKYDEQQRFREQAYRAEQHTRIKLLGEENTSIDAIRLKEIVATCRQRMKSGSTH